MTTGAAIGHTSEFHIWDTDAGPAAFVRLAGVTSITPPSESSDVIDVTDMDSTDGVREFILGLTDPGECSIELNFVPSNATDELIRAVRGRRTAETMKIVYPNSAVWTFSGLITGYQPAAPLDDKLTASLTVKVTATVAVT